jgi:hypothetical protein
MARKIEQQITAAVRARQGFIGGNTSVACMNAPSGLNAGRVQVVLHKSIIADLIGGELSLSFCGWPTDVTASRLNCVLEGLGLRSRYVAAIRQGEGVFLNANDLKPIATGELTVRLDTERTYA